MPVGWDERVDVLAERAQQERSAALRYYISCRRAEPETASVLASEELPCRRQRLKREGKRTPARVQWSDGAPKRPIEIHHFYNEGVYAELQRKIEEVARGAREAVEGGEENTAARGCRVGYSRR